MNSEAKYPIALAVFLLGWLQAGIAGAVFVAVFAFLIWKAAKALKRAEELRRWAKRAENVYIVGCHPDDPERRPKLHLPKDAPPDLVFFVPHEEVLKSVEEAKALLEACHNCMWQGGHMSIYPFIYQEGEFANESWKDYGRRCAAFILPDREARHKKMRKLNGDDYLRHVRGQV